MGLRDWRWGRRREDFFYYWVFARFLTTDNVEQGQNVDVISALPDPSQT